MNSPLTTDPVSLNGRSDPANKCAFRHLCKAESAAYLRIAEANEKLSAQNKELARLLRYAAQHSSLARHMNDSWREEALTALENVGGT